MNYVSNAEAIGVWSLIILCVGACIVLIGIVGVMVALLLSRFYD